MLKFSQRLKIMIDSLGISGNEFDLKCGFSEGYTLKAIKNKSDIGYKRLIKILTVFTDYSPQWLLTGEGEMMKSDVFLGNFSDFKKDFPAICITNKKGQVLKINDEHTKQTGFTLEEIKGKKPSKYLRRSDFPLSESVILRKKLQTKNGIYEEIFPNYTKHGLPILCCILIFPIVYNGEITGYTSHANFKEMKRS